VLLVAEQQTPAGAAWAALGQQRGRFADVLAGPAAGPGLVRPVAGRGPGGRGLQPGGGTSGQPRIGIKWPNDLWLEGDRKLAGILIETALFGPGPRQVIVGGHQHPPPA
jgi:BirA family biotin operon repressor/biotin-[acetyl-CoA-carboxylase] ligase